MSRRAPAGRAAAGACPVAARSMAAANSPNICAATSPLSERPKLAIRPVRYSRAVAARAVACGPRSVTVSVMSA